jgi:hypothetical protein
MANGLHIVALVSARNVKRHARYDEMARGIVADAVSGQLHDILEFELTKGPKSKVLSNGTFGEGAI